MKSTRQTEKRKDRKRPHEDVTVSNDEHHNNISRNPSTDSVIYVGTFYYSYPVIDLTRSESNLPSTFTTNDADKQNNELMENNVLHGDSPAINPQLSVITIRPASVNSLVSSASENTLYNDSQKVDGNDGNLKTIVAEESRSELKLRHSYPLSQNVEIVPKIVTNNSNSLLPQSQAEAVVQEIIASLPDVVVNATETSGDSVKSYVPELVITDNKENDCKECGDFDFTTNHSIQ